MHIPTSRYILWLAALLIIAAAFWILSVPFNSINIPTPPAPETNATPLRTPPPPPPLTPQRMVKAIGTKQFSTLVSYTDQGFEPNQATVRAGDTVRFTNNSTHTMSLSQSSAPQDLPPGQYWEYTFAKAGDTTITESATNATVIIHVQ